MLSIILENLPSYRAVALGIAGLLALSTQLRSSDIIHSSTMDRIMAQCRKEYSNPSLVAFYGLGSNSLLALCAFMQIGIKSMLEIVLVEPMGWWVPYDFENAANYLLGHATFALTTWAYTTYGGRNTEWYRAVALPTAAFSMNENTTNSQASPFLQKIFYGALLLPGLEFIRARMSDFVEARGDSLELEGAKTPELNSMHHTNSFGTGESKRTGKAGHRNANFSIGIWRTLLTSSYEYLVFRAYISIVESKENVFAHLAAWGGRILLIKAMSGGGIKFFIACYQHRALGALWKYFTASSVLFALESMIAKSMVRSEYTMGDIINDTTCQATLMLIGLHSVWFNLGLINSTSGFKDRNARLAQKSLPRNRSVKSTAPKNSGLRLLIDE